MAMSPADRVFPEQRLESVMGDLKPAYTANQARAEADRCLYCLDAPCIKACPTAINIPEFIRRIATDNVRGAARTIFEANILGYSCAKVCPVEVLCAGDCVFNRMGRPPIEIGRLQRFATDWAYDNAVGFFEKGAPTGKKIALVGAGPASLACAHELTVLGHDCTLFEARPFGGGLNTTGVAPYKMQAHDAVREVDYVASIGFTIRYGVEAGKDISIDELLESHDALFIGVGLGKDSFLDVPGKDLPGVHGALELIETIKNTNDGSAFESVKRAAIIGGGNTALDVVRELRRLDIAEVMLLYRRGSGDMSGYKHEADGARREGVSFHFYTTPTAYLEEQGQVSAVRCQRTEIVDGRVRAIEGSDFDLPVDLVALATGQERLDAFFASLPDVRFEGGRVVVDAVTGVTDNPRIFSGGDCANGGKEVVNAAAEGKAAAHGIQRLLCGD